MTQHLIRTLTDSTGHTFTHITQARENETFIVVDAESAEEAKEKVKLLNRISDEDKESIGKLMKLQRIIK